MATIADAPPEHRGLAEQIPVDIRERLDPAELRIRLAEAARMIGQIGHIPDAGTARGLSAHAVAMLKALPFAELEDQCRQLADSARSVAAPADSGGFLDAAAKLKRENPQPRAMTQAAHLAETGGAGHLAASREPEHRQLAAAAALIRAQREQIKTGNTAASSSSAPAKRTGPARDRHETPDVTKTDQGESVPFLTKAAGARRFEGVTRADIVKAVEAAVDASGMTERLDAVAAELGRTRAHLAGQTKTTTGGPVTDKMRGTP